MTRVLGEIWIMSMHSPLQYRDKNVMCPNARMISVSSLSNVADTTPTRILQI